MSDVVVRITGDNKELDRTLTDSEKKLKKFSDGSKNAASGIDTIGKSSAKSNSILSSLSGKFKDGLGISLAIGGIKLFGSTVEQVMNRARQQAALTQAAFESAFSSTVGFNVATDSFKITSREDAVRLGRDAQAQLNEVRRQLENNFSNLINSDLISGSLERILTAGSIVGLGDEQLTILRSLKEQEARLQSQVTQYTLISQRLTEISKLSTNLTNKGFTVDDGLTLQQRARNFLTSRAAIPPAFTNPDDLFSDEKLSDFLKKNNLQSLARQLPGRTEVDDITDAFGEFSIQLKASQQAVQAGVIPALDGFNQQAGLIQQQLVSLLEQGVDPSNAAFQQMLTNMLALEEQSNALSNEVNGGAIALRILGDVGIGVLDQIAFKFEEADSKAAQFRNTLRGIGNRFLNVALNAGINVGIGALTGNPLSFGQALASGLGIPTASTAGVGNVGSATGTASAASFQRPKLEVVGFRMGGGDLLLTMQEAQGTRGKGGISLD